MSQESYDDYKPVPIEYLNEKVLPKLSTLTLVTNPCYRTTVRIDPDHPDFNFTLVGLDAVSKIFSDPTSKTSIRKCIIEEQEFDPETNRTHERLFLARLETKPGNSISAVVFEFEIESNPMLSTWVSSIIKFREQTVLVASSSTVLMSQMHALIEVFNRLCNMTYSLAAERSYI